MSTHIVSYTLLLLTVILSRRAVHLFSVNENLYTQKPFSNENFNLEALRPCQKILPGQMDHPLIQSGNSMGCHAVKWLGGQLRKFYLMHEEDRDRKSTRLNSSHVAISYAVFCLKKKTNNRLLHCLTGTIRTE